MPTPTPHQLRNWILNMRCCFVYQQHRFKSTTLDAEVAAKAWSPRLLQGFWRMLWAVWQCVQLLDTTGSLQK
jgi:hypothetical protein